MNKAPIDETITIDQLTLDPYPVYRRLRSDAPVLRVTSVGRTLLTKAEDTRAVKDNPELFSSNDPGTPMERAFKAHTLMRKDGADHMRERQAMTPAFSPKNLKTVWAPKYLELAEQYVGQLPRGEIVDLYPLLAGPLAACFLAHLMGIPHATDEDMQRWSQILIDGAGNFGWQPGPFERSDTANAEIDTCIEAHAHNPGDREEQSALSVMLAADDPLPMSQIIANIKIAIGGGINEPRDALLTMIYGLLTNPDQLDEIKRANNWGDAFEEGVRWVAPIQTSSRLVMADTEIRGHFIPKGDVVMTVQASANHDEELFDRPERFDAFRVKKPHQAFGSGPHHCLGAHISRRFVGQIILPLLFDSFPGMELPDPHAVRWRGFGFRGPIELPVLLN